MSKLITFFKIKLSDQISFLAVIISGISLMVGGYQFIVSQNRQIAHDQLSVRPILMFEFHGLTNDSYVGFVLKNKGVGPALVDWLEIFYKGKTVKSWKALNN